MSAGRASYLFKICSFWTRAKRLSLFFMFDFGYSLFYKFKVYTVKLGNKERFVKELIGIKEPFPVTKLPFTSYE
jgi:hypothetical protein